MGGWENTITQKTKLTPAIVKEVLLTIRAFQVEFNQYLESNGHKTTRVGNLLGSTAYAMTDPDDTEYGDIDIQMIAPEVPGKTSYEISTHFNKLINDFITEVKPSYICTDGKPTNGHLIFNLADDKHVQVDMLWTVNRLVNWNRWRRTPMRGIKGLVMGNLFSTLGEVINMSLQSAVLMKIKDGEPINYQRGRNADEVVEVSTNIENFGIDILEYVYDAVYGPLGDIQISPELQSHPGLNTDNVQISDIVHTVRGLAHSFELNDLYGKHVLKDLMNAEDLINTYLKRYLAKANRAGHGAKLNKAVTPAELAKVQELREKINKGVQIVEREFAENA